MARAIGGAGATTTASERRSPQAAPLRFQDGVLGPATRLRVFLISRATALYERRAEAALRRHVELWRLVEAAAAGNAVTGVSFGDYLTLYRFVRRHRPREILECGTGLSTVVLAQALRENERDGFPRGRVTSMEDVPHWMENARARFPAELAPYVDFVLSEKVDGFYKCFRGVRYAALPDRPYDFVFSDGPERHSPVNGDKLFNLDLLEVVRRSDTPVWGIVDDHYLTAYVLQKVLGPEKARYSAIRKLLFVGPVTREDVGFLRRENFAPDLRLLGPTRFRLRFARRRP
ncbi:MAG: class I SAM-dependent methyltransferase [Rhodospirillales bacterium]|nr:class I SAM-dependent methyltransferase [Rhodospirillales bacterium]